MACQRAAAAVGLGAVCPWCLWSVWAASSGSCVPRQFRGVQPAGVFFWPQQPQHAGLCGCCLNALARCAGAGCVALQRPGWAAVGVFCGSGSLQDDPWAGLWSVSTQRATLLPLCAAQQQQSAAVEQHWARELSFRARHALWAHAQRWCGPQRAIEGTRVQRRHQPCTAITRHWFWWLCGSRQQLSLLLAQLRLSI